MAVPITTAERTNASQPKIASFRWLALQRPMRAAMFREDCGTDIACLSICLWKSTWEHVEDPSARPGRLWRSLASGGWGKPHYFPPGSPVWDRWGVRPGSSRSLIALTAGGALGVIGSVALVLTSDHETDKAFQVIAGAVVAPSFMGTGLFAWRRRPHNHTGLLMYVVGVAFILGSLKEANAPVLFDLGLIFGNLFIA